MEVFRGKWTSTQHIKLKFNKEYNQLFLAFLNEPLIAQKIDHLKKPL